MKIINLADNRDRNTRVVLEPRKAKAKTAYVNENSQYVKSVRMVKNTLETDLKALTEEVSLDDLSQSLIDGDPEIDLELFGRQVQETTRLYLNHNNEPAQGVVLKEEIHLADGSLKEVRDFLVQESNINGDKPIKGSGKMMPKKKFFNKFVFGGAYQITHVDGLTFDFLYNMAKELETEEALLYVAGGEKNDEPLVLTRNGTSYRGFLEGRIQDDKYMLILHLTNLELKNIGDA